MTSNKDSKNSKNSQDAALIRLRNLSNILDNAVAIPGTSYKIGLDPIIGLIPGGGDIASSALSAYIVFSAGMLGAPPAILVQMVINILLDTFAGIIPVIGDLFDVAWKANVKNMELLEVHFGKPQPASTKKASKGFIFLLVGIVMLVAIAVAAVSALLVTLLFRAIAG